MTSSDCKRTSEEDLDVHKIDSINQSGAKIGFRIRLAGGVIMLVLCQLNTLQ